MNNDEQDKTFKETIDNAKKTLESAKAYCRKHERILRNLCYDFATAILIGIAIAMCMNAGLSFTGWLLFIPFCLSVLCPRIKSIIEITDDEQALAEDKIRNLQKTKEELLDRMKDLRELKRNLIAECERFKTELERRV